ncbi:MAG TPA: hypothetical protein GXZ43_05245 [Clostridiaceae bacterium]|nr:hypothetical protein [Clostridiaceae bacterium]
MSCLYLEQGGLFSISYFCKKEKADVDSAWANDYCKSNVKYKECPRYKGGSGGSGCFITTACMRAKGLSDDCDELVTFRAFRDKYVVSRQDGKNNLAVYYSVAPKIVEYLNKQRNAQERYNYLYDELIIPFKRLIDDGKNEEAYSFFYIYVNSLWDECNANDK